MCDRHGGLRCACWWDGWNKSTLHFDEATRAEARAEKAEATLARMNAARIQEVASVRRQWEDAARHDEARIRELEATLGACGAVQLKQVGRIKRLEAAMAFFPLPRATCPQFSAAHAPHNAFSERQIADFAWSWAFDEIRRKAGLDKPNATTRKTFEATDRGEGLTECRDAEDLFRKAGLDEAKAERHCRDCRNHAPGLPNALCDSCSFPERTNFAAKEADRGLKGEPGKPDLDEALAKALFGWAVTRSWKDGDKLARAAERWLRSREGHPLPEEKPAPQQPGE